VGQGVEATMVVQHKGGGKKKKNKRKEGVGIRDGCDGLSSGREVETFCKNSQDNHGTAVGVT